MEEELDHLLAARKRIGPKEHEKIPRKVGVAVDRLSEKQSEDLREMEQNELRKFYVPKDKSPSQEEMKPMSSSQLEVTVTSRSDPISVLAKIESRDPKSHPEGQRVGTRFLPLKWEERLENIKIIKNLGKGEFGKVDLAIAGTDDKRKLYAVKSMKDVKEDPLLEDHAERLLEAFHNEIHILMKIKHPRIVEAMGVDIQETPLFIMTYYENGSLLDYLREKTTAISHRQRLAFLVELTEGVHFLQSKRILHRDIAARNCLLDIALHLRICDFGFAVELDEEADEYIDEWEWRPYRFLPPEVFSHNVYSLKTDIFSIGVMIYEIYANGFTPFDDLLSPGMSIFQKEVFVLDFWGNQKCVLPIPPPATKDLVRIAFDCWEVDPDHRPEIDGLLTRIQACK